MKNKNDNVKLKMCQVTDHFRFLFVILHFDF